MIFEEWIADLDRRCATTATMATTTAIKDIVMNEQPQQPKLTPKAPAVQTLAVTAHRISRIVHRKKRSTRWTSARQRFTRTR